MKCQILNLDLSGRHLDATDNEELKLHVKVTQWIRDTTEIYTSSKYLQQGTNFVLMSRRKKYDIQYTTFSAALWKHQIAESISFFTQSPVK